MVVGRGGGGRAKVPFRRPCRMDFLWPRYQTLRVWLISSCAFGTKRDRAESRGSNTRRPSAMAVAFSPTECFILDRFQSDINSPSSVRRTPSPPRGRRSGCGGNSQQFERILVLITAAANWWRAACRVLSSFVPARRGPFPDRRARWPHRPGHWHWHWGRDPGRRQNHRSARWFP